MSKDPMPDSIENTDATITILNRLQQRINTESDERCRTHMSASLELAEILTHTNRIVDIHSTLLKSQHLTIQSHQIFIEKGGLLKSMFLYLGGLAQILVLSATGYLFGNITDLMSDIKVLNERQLAFREKLDTQQVEISNLHRERNLPDVLP